MAWLAQDALKDLTKAASLAPDYECYHQRGIVYHKMVRRCRRTRRADGAAIQPVPAWYASAAVHD